MSVKDHTEELRFLMGLGENVVGDTIERWKRKRAAKPYEDAKKRLVARSKARQAMKKHRNTR